MKRYLSVGALVAMLTLYSSLTFALTSSVGDLKVVHNAVHDGKTGVRIIVYDLTVQGHKDKQFYLGMEVFQGDDWAGLWTASDHFDNSHDPGFINGEVQWFFFSYDLLKTKIDPGKPFFIAFFVMNSEDGNDYSRKDVAINLADAVAAPKKPVAVKAQKKKNSARLTRIRGYIERLTALGPIGTLTGTPPEDPAQRVHYDGAKSKMEVNEKKIHTGVKKKTTDKSQKTANAEVDKVAQTETAAKETQVKEEAAVIEQQATPQAEQKLKAEATPQAQKAEEKVAADEKKGEAEVEEEADEAEAEVEKAQKENKSESELKGICGMGQKAIELADQQARELINKGAEYAKEQAKKQIEAAAEKLKEETVGRLESKVTEFKDAIRAKVNETSETLGAQVKTESTALVTAQVNAAVGAMPDELKPYAEQFRPQVEEKVNVTLEKQVDEVMDKASRKIVKTAGTKLDAVVKKVTGPIHDAIDKQTEAAIQFANDKIDAARDAALKKLDEKKEQATGRLKQSCEKKDTAPTFAYSYSNEVIQVGLSQRNKVTFADSGSQVYESGSGEVVLKLPGTGPIVFSGCTFAVIIDPQNQKPRIIRPNGECTGMTVNFGFLSGTLARFERIDVNDTQVSIRGLFINAPRLVFGTDSLTVSAFFKVNVTYSAAAGNAGCADVSFQSPVPNIRGATKSWSSPTMSVGATRAELQGPTVRWRRTGCNSFEREFAEP